MPKIKEPLANPSAKSQTGIMQEQLSATPTLVHEQLNYDHNAPKKQKTNEQKHILKVLFDDLNVADKSSKGLAKASRGKKKKSQNC